MKQRCYALKMTVVGFISTMSRVFGMSSRRCTRYVLLSVMVLRGFCYWLLLSFLHKLSICVFSFIYKLLYEFFSSSWSNVTIRTMIFLDLLMFLIAAYHGLCSDTGKLVDLVDIMALSRGSFCFLLSMKLSRRYCKLSNLYFRQL